jgi:hypothetical protein
MWGRCQGDLATDAYISYTRARRLGPAWDGMEPRMSLRPGKPGARDAGGPGALGTDGGAPRGTVGYPLGARTYSCCVLLIAPWRYVLLVAGASDVSDHPGPFRASSRVASAGRDLRRRIASAAVEDMHVCGRSGTRGEPN